MSGNQDNQNCLNCVKAIEQRAEISTPVSVKVQARMGDVEMCCDGDPSLVVTDCCEGCRLLVIQRLNMRIPLHYYASVQTEQSTITCADDC